MRLIIKDDKAGVAQCAAAYIVNAINTHFQHSDQPFVLGLPTGSTPLETYKELIGYYQRGEVSFARVITFNMDEYVGLSADHPESYHYFMHENFFKHIDINPKHIHILDGMASDLEQECKQFEDLIAQVGGIDLFLGGVGSDGHIAFNEPYSSLQSRTRVKTLTQETIIANSRFFGGDTSLVPTTALTVGVGTILSSRQVLILATGQSKGLAVQQCIEGSYNHKWTVTALQIHPCGILVCDEDAVGELKVSTYRYFKDIEGNN